MLRIVVYPGVVLAVLSLCPGYFRTFAADEVHLTYISPPAGSCSELELKECISAIGDFSAGIRPAVTLAERQVNQMGTYLHQRRLNIHMMQPESCERKAVLDPFLYDIFNKSSPPKLAVVGTGCTRTSEAVAEVSQYYSLSQMSFSSSSLSLSSRETFPFFFRTIPSDEYLSAAMVAIITAFKWTRVTIITQDAGRFRAFQDELSSELKKENVTIIRNQLIPNNLTLSSTEELFPPDVRIFILNMDPRSGRAVLCQAFHRLEWERWSYVWVTQGWYQDYWWKTGGKGGGGGDDVNCSDDEVLKFLARQRVIGVSPALDADSTLSTTYNMSSHDFSEAYIALLSNETDFTRLAFYAYDAVWSVVLALSNESSTVYDFDPFNISTESKELGDMIRRSLEDLNFIGVTGRVKFLDGSRETEKVNLLQYLEGFKYPNVTTCVSFNAGNPDAALLEDRDALWPSDEVPPDGSPYTVEQYPSIVLVVVSNVLAGVTIILAMVCIVFNFVFRNRKLIRISSPNLNFIIAVGAIVFCGSVFFFAYPPLSHEVLNAYCGIRSWFAAIGYSLCFGTVNTKMWRVYYIFKDPKPSSKKKPLKDIHLVLCVVVFVVVDVSILTIATGLSATRLVATVFPNREGLMGVDSQGVTVNYVVVLCESRYKSLWLGVLFGYKFIIQGVGVFLAFKIRKVKVKVLNDSKEVVATLYLTSIILVVVLAITIFLDEYVNVYAAGYSFGITLSTVVMLGVVFLSKMVKLYKDPQGETLFTHVTKEAGCTGASAIAMTMDEQKIMNLQRKIHDLEDQVVTMNRTKQDTAAVVPNGKHVQIVLDTSPENSSHQE